MAVKIRLTRVGNRNNPFFRIVAANGQDPNNGKAIEYLGTYDPKRGGRTVLKTSRYDYWIGVGAIPSDTVKSLVPGAIDHASTLKKEEKSTPEPETAEAAEEPAVEEASDAEASSESTEEEPAEETAAEESK